MEKFTITLCLFILLCFSHVIRAASNPSSDQQIKNLNTLLEQLASSNIEDREAAIWGIENLPIEDLPLLQEIKQRENLSPEVRTRFLEVMSRLEPRLKARQRKQLRRKASYDEMRRLMLDVYQKSGRTDPSWDNLVKTAFNDFVDNQEHIANAKSLAEVKKEFQMALDAGCDDPETQYAFAQVLWDEGGNSQEIYRQFKTGVAAMEFWPDVPILLKAEPHAWLAKAQLHANPDEAEPTVPNDYKLALKHFCDGLSTYKVSAARATEMARTIIDAYQPGWGSVIDPFNEIYPSLEKAYPNSPEPLVLKGDIFVRWAWEARGDGYASTVTSKGMQQMTDRLDIANEALTNAYALDPDDAGAATEMLRVELGQGKGRNVMERWFQRAMDADPDNSYAAQLKLNYLSPKWYGSPEDMLEFGRQCVKEGNWSAKIPFILIDAHDALSEYAPDKDAYFLQPGPWKDIQSVYEPYLKQFPEANTKRSRYAKWACTCGKWKTAVRLFDELGDHPDVSAFDGQANYDYLRRKAFAKVEAELSPTSKAAPN